MKTQRVIKESRHYHQGKADAFEGRVNCRSEKGTPDHMDYFRGFKEGLAEAYGCDESVMENNTPMMSQPPAAAPMQPAAPMTTTAGSTTPGSSTSSVPTAMNETDLDETMFLNDDEDSDLDATIDNIMNDIDAEEAEEELDEVSKGEWIDQAKAKARAAGKDSVEVFGQDMPVDEMADFADLMESAIRRDSLMNSWNQQLAALLIEAEQSKDHKDCDCDKDPCECDDDEESDMKKKISEGMTVTTTTGSQYGPDSVNINATDEDAHELMRILKHSGISTGFGSEDDAHHDDDFESEEASCDDDIVDSYDEMPAARGMMMSTQEKPHAEIHSLQPRQAVNFDDIIDAFGGRMSVSEAEDLAAIIKLSGKDILEAIDSAKGKGMSTRSTEESVTPEYHSPKEVMLDVKKRKKISEGTLDMPDGKGMSKNVKEKQVKPLEPTDQSAIMSTLKPEETKTNTSLQKLQKSHDAGPASKEGGAPKVASVSKKHDFENASLSEQLSHDLLKLYTISEDAAQTNTVTGYKYVDAMAMPRGMGMSVQVEDEPQKLIEPTDHEDVMKALDQGEPKPVKFPKLEKLLKNHMPDTEEPKIMPKQSEAETRKINGPIDSLKTSSSDSKFENEIDEDDNSEEKVTEGRETCSECGGYMEEDHQCEDTDKEHLEEWANDQGRIGTDEAQLMDTDFMVNKISGGLNGQKRDQTTLPHTEVKVRGGDDLTEWLRLSGLR